jgi:hypothetical protein
MPRTNWLTSAFFAFLYLSAPYYVDLQGVCQDSKYIFFEFLEFNLK